MPKGGNMPTVDLENSIHIEVEGTAKAKELSLEDKVEIIIKGKVEGITQRASYEDDERKISVIELSGYSSKIIGQRDGKFSDLADD